MDYLQTIFLFPDRRKRTRKKSFPHCTKQNNSQYICSGINLKVIHPEIF